MANPVGHKKKHPLYGTKAWHRLRTKQLMSSPLCGYCLQIGITRAAQVVDHIKPHKGDTSLFHDPENLQSLCKPCHDRHKQRLERTGQLPGNGIDGMPLDSRHHWNA